MYKFIHYLQETGNSMILRVISILITTSFISGYAAFSGSDYSEAMRMAVKFYGAQRCGNTHNWMLHENKNLTTPAVCHTKDAYQGTDMSGGWHDCGDHIKVATTMGYAAICLLSAYDVWPAAFADTYDTAYKGPNGIPDVLDEAKIATDYFLKSLIDNKTFVYYLGGDQDHNKWVTSSFQSTLGASEGGDPRPSMASTSSGGAQVADYASALALMAKHYPDQAYAAKCKAAAISYYDWAKAHQSNISIPSFYSSPNSEISDELSLAAILLFHLTKTESYKTDALNYLKEKWESNSALAWDTKADISYYYIVKADPNAKNSSGGFYKNFLAKNVSKGIAGAGSNQYGFPWGFLSNNWGTNKLACGSAFASALLGKLLEDKVVTSVEPAVTADQAYSYTAKIVDYMLGNNEFKHPFLHGYKGDMTHKVHHRNAMGRDDNPPTATKNTATFMFASGALIGGPSAANSFSNIIEGGNAFMETESGCDYNGPFIGAQANLVSKLDPKTPVKKFSSDKSVTSFRTTAKTVVDIRGRTLQASGITNTSGIYFVNEQMATHSRISKIISSGK
jgi:hypothetical protein